jgi:hypothetical protein
MVLGWFDTRAVVAFAQEAARDIQGALPPGEAPRRVRGDKRARRLERVIGKAQRFVSENKLNTYKKAKLVNTLKWSLKEAGYPDEFIDDIVGLVLVNL